MRVSPGRRRAPAVDMGSHLVNAAGTPPSAMTLRWCLVSAVLDRHVTLAHIPTTALSVILSVPLYLGCGTSGCICFRPLPVLLKLRHCQVARESSGSLWGGPSRNTARALISHSSPRLHLHCPPISSLECSTHPPCDLSVLSPWHTY